MRSVLSPADLMFDKPADPGWYPLEIVEYTEEVTKGSEAKPSDGSMNAIFTFKALDGPDNVKNKTFKRYFNEKALYFGKNLWAVLFPTFNKDKGGELTSEMFRSTVSKKLMGYIKMEGKYATIVDYRPMEGSK